MTDDELDNLLTPTPSIAAPREEIFARTTALRSRQRLQRTLVRWLGIATVFLLGIALGWFAKPMPAHEVRIEYRQEVVPSPPELPVSSEPLAMTPEMLELEAEKATDPAASAEWYKKAGDLYVRNRDTNAAIRCYQQHLLEGGKKVSTPANEDTLLLTSLKLELNQENRRANANTN